MTETKTGRVLKFPIAVTAGGRKFEIDTIGTTDLWYLYSEYEGLIVTMAAESEGGGIPKLDRETSRSMVDLMKELCELCRETDKSQVLFDTYFAPGDPTPIELTQNVVRELFGGFLAGNGQSEYQPLVAALASPLMAPTTAS